GAIVEEAAVLAGKGHALSHALVDDVDAELGQAVDIRFPRAEVSSLYRVVEEAEDAVPVVSIVLGRVDPALGGNRVSPARAVLVAKAQYLVAQLGQRSRGGSSGQARAHNDHRELPLVGRIHELHFEAVLLPLLFD